MPDSNPFSDEDPTQPMAADQTTVESLRAQYAERTHERERLLEALHDMRPTRDLVADNRPQERK